MKAKLQSALHNSPGKMIFHFKKMKKFAIEVSTIIVKGNKAYRESEPSRNTETFLVFFLISVSYLSEIIIFMKMGQNIGFNNKV